MNLVTAMSAGSGLSSGLFKQSSRKILRCPEKGLLLEILEKKISRGNSRIQELVASYLNPRSVVELTTDLPSGFDSYEIDAFLKRIELKPVDSCFSVIGKEEWVKIFGETTLNAQGLTFEQPSFLHSLNDVRQWVTSLRQLELLIVENNAGFTLLTLPDGLTLNKFIALAKKPRPGHQSAVIQSPLMNLIKIQHGNRAVKGGVVAISNAPLDGSRATPIATQKELLKFYGCQMPRVVEVVALCFVTYINSSRTELNPVRLLNKDFWQFTRCVEQLEGFKTFGLETISSDHLIVGGFSSDGLMIDSDCLNQENFAVVAVRRF